MILLFIRLPQYGTFDGYESGQFGTHIGHMQLGIKSREQHLQSRSRTIQVNDHLHHLNDEQWSKTKSSRNNAFATNTWTCNNNYSRKISVEIVNDKLLIFSPSFRRVLMLGDTAVGKSSLVSQFMTSEYLHAYDTSIGELMSTYDFVHSNRGHYFVNQSN